MYVLSSNGASIVDLTGMTIVPIQNQVQMEDGSIQSQLVGFELIGYGIGYNVSLGMYDLEKQVRDIFNDILKEWQKGKTDFYDVHLAEQKFIGRVG